MSLAGVAEVYRPIISISVFDSKFQQHGFSVDALIDTGSDWCLFPDWLAHRLKLDLLNSPNLRIRGATGPLQVSVHEIGLEIGQGASRFRWRCSAGFVPYQTPLFASGDLSGILGHYGGLDQFETAFDWCAGLPQIRMTNCRPSLPTV